MKTIATTLFLLFASTLVPAALVHAEEPGPLPGFAEATAWVPADWDSAVVVPNMRTLSDEMARFAGEVGLTDKPFVNLLQTMTDGGVWHPSLNADAPLVLSLVNLDALSLWGSGPEPILVALFKPNDYGELMAALDGDPTTPISTISLVGESVHVRAVGDLAILSNHRPTVEAYAVPTASLFDQLSPLSRAAGGRNHATFLLNIADASSVVSGLFDLGRDILRDMLRRPGTTGGLSGLADAVVELLDQATQDTGVLLLGVDFTEGSLRYNMVAQMKPDSTSAAILGTPTPAQELLALLPDSPYRGLAVATFDGFDMTRLVALIGADLGAEPTAELVLTHLNSWPLVSGFATMYHDLDDESAPGRASVYTSPDATALLTGLRARQRAVNRYWSVMMEAETGAPTQISYDEGAVEIGGYSFDRYHVVLPWVARSELDAERLASSYLAPVGGRLLQVQTDDVALIPPAVLGLDDGVGPDHANTSAARARALAEGPFLEIYLDLANLARYLSPKDEPAAIPGLEGLVTVFGHLVDDSLAVEFEIPNGALRVLNAR